MGFRLAALLTSLALVAALLGVLMPSGTATAGTSKLQRCLDAASEALGKPARASAFRVQLGTSRNDRFRTTRMRDLICGFAGNDRISDPRATLRRGDLFIGGTGRDSVRVLRGGRFIAGPGRDRVGGQFGGTYAGGPGSDRALCVYGGVFRGGKGNDGVWDDRDPCLPGSGVFFGGVGDDTAVGMTFFAGPGDDRIQSLFRGTVRGGAGDDTLEYLTGGTIRGGTGNDLVEVQDGGRFSGGIGLDTVAGYENGILDSVESCAALPGFSCP